MYGKVIIKSYDKVTYIEDCISEVIIRDGFLILVKKQNNFESDHLVYQLIKITSYKIQWRQNL